jgi:hypothetical protein
VIPDGTIFVGDGSNQRVREISIYGYVTTFAGSGTAGFENGSDTLATFNFPRGTVLDIPMNRLYVVDYNNHAVRIVHLVPVTGTTEPPAPEGIRVFPNPSSGTVTIDLRKEQGCTEIRVRNAVGQLLRTYPASGNDRLEIGLHEQPEGIYYLEFMEGERRLGIQKLLLGD